jgi:hypothetical protein
VRQFLSCIPTTALTVSLPCLLCVRLSPARVIVASRLLRARAVPDSAPWITYTGAWGDSDLATQDYNNGTFHFTDQPGATASFPFNGTGVWLYGAWRGNHVRPGSPASCAVRVR